MPALLVSAACLRLLLLALVVTFLPLVTDHLGLTDQVTPARAQDSDDDDDGGDGDDGGDDSDDGGDDGGDDDGGDDRNDGGDGDDGGDDSDDGGDDDGGDDDGGDDDGGDDGDDGDGDDGDGDDNGDDDDGGDDGDGDVGDDNGDGDVGDDNGDDDNDDRERAAASARSLEQLDRSSEAPLLGNWQSVEPSGGRETPTALIDEILGAGLDAAAQAELTALGYTIIEIRPLAALGLEILRIGIPGIRSAAAEVDFLAGRFPAAVFDRHHLFRPATGCVAPDCFFSEALTGLPRGASGCGAGLRIGMVDALVDETFAGLRGQRLTSRDVSGAAERAADHGTAIATLLVGRPDGRAPGLLPEASLYAAAVVTSVGDGADALPLATAIDLLTGLDWLAAENVVAINVSLTGSANAPLALALRNLRARGIAVIAAAGNEGPIESAVYPAAYPEVVGVTAVDRFQRIYRFANRGDHVDFSAPGVAVWTDVGPSGREQTGTSFATPWLTAILASELALTGDDLSLVLARLAAESADLGAAGRDPVFGHGLIQRLSPCEASG